MKEKKVPLIKYNFSIHIKYSYFSSQASSGVEQQVAGVTITQQGLLCIYIFFPASVCGRPCQHLTCPRNMVK